MDQALKPQLKVVGGHAWSPVPAVTPPAPQDVTLIVENMRCGSCMVAVEKALLAATGVQSARVNLSAKRVAVRYDAQSTDVEQLTAALDRAGFRAAEATYAPTETANAQASDLLRRLGVAGFAAANVMLLSVSVWAGLASDMDHSSAALFHWLSALIALPAIVYAGQPFFRSAMGALRAKRLNMDVPISLGIILASAMSLFQTMQGGDQVYFDAAITLTFLLLIGRYLDESVRVKAKGAAENLIGLKALAATVIGSDGKPRRMPARALQPGMRILVAAGERIPVDGRVTSGVSEIEESLITGETLPRLVRETATVHAGTVNISTPIEVEATATDEGTLIAEIARLMQAAEQGRGRYVRLADRAARIYAPGVHILGAVTFIAWMLAGAGWEQALTYAIAVLIITCPCALALAVPAVHVAATGRLFAKGVIVKAPDALERLAETDAIVLDKTGTLTFGEPRLLDPETHRHGRAGASGLAGGAQPPPLLQGHRQVRAGARPRAITAQLGARDPRQRAHRRDIGGRGAPRIGGMGRRQQRCDASCDALVPQGASRAGAVSFRGRAQTRCPRGGDGVARGRLFDRDRLRRPPASRRGRRGRCRHRRLGRQRAPRRQDRTAA